MFKVGLFSVLVTGISHIYIMAGFNPVMAWIGTSVWIGSMFLPQV